MDGKSRLVQGGRDGLSLLSGDGMSFENKRMQVLLRNVEDRMLRDLVHNAVVRWFRLIIVDIKITILNGNQRKNDGF